MFNRLLRGLSGSSFGCVVRSQAVKCRVSLVDRAHALRGFGLIDGIARPPVRMPRLREPFVLLLQLLSTRAWPETVPATVIHRCASIR